VIIIIMSFNAGKRKLSGAGRRKIEKQKQTAEGELLKKIPKVSIISLLIFLCIE